MFTPITLTGRVTADLELQTSQNNTEYVQFNVAVNKGYGEQEHANFYQCVLFGKASERISKAGVKKGSLLLYRFLQWPAGRGFPCDSLIPAIHFTQDSRGCLQYRRFSSDKPGMEISPAKIGSPCS